MSFIGGSTIPVVDEGDEGVMEDAWGGALVVLEVAPPTNMADGPHRRVTVGVRETDWPDCRVENGRVAEFDQSYVIFRHLMLEGNFLFQSHSPILC